MTTELRYLLLTALLTGSLGLPVLVAAKITTPRRWVNRASAAHEDAVENLAPFAAVVLTAHVSGHNDALTAGAATAFFWSRLAHAIVQITGISRHVTGAVIITAGWIAFLTLAIDIALQAF